MSRSRSPLPWVLAVILGLAVAPVDAHRALHPRTAPAPAAVTPDEAFVQARRFAYREDLARFDAAAAQVGPTTLRPWLDYWRLKIRLAKLQPPDPATPAAASPAAAPAEIVPGADSPVADGAPAAGQPSVPPSPEAVAVDRDVSAFLAANDGTAVAESMRHDWLASLGRRGDWATFEAQYPLWTPHDDAQLACWSWLGDLRQGRPLPAQARGALMQPRDLGEACGALVEELAARGELDRDELWHRLELALEVNAIASVRTLAPFVGLTQGDYQAALLAPSRILAPGIDPRIAVIAFTQIARRDPEAAAARTDALAGLPPAERSFVWSQIAADGMRKLDPGSLAWTREALSARASDVTWEWLARSALRDGDWPTLAAVIDRMSPAGRQHPAWVYWKARALRATGRGDEADALLRTIAGRFHFYGQLAAEELGRLTTIPAPAPPPTDEEIAEASRNEGFARALKLYGLGLRAEGNREWNFQLRGMDDRQLLAAAAWACRQGVLDRCVNTADRTRSQHDFSLRFVTPYLAQLEPVARRRDLDPAWVYGLIRQESRFVMDVRSSAGAHGLMQIIPSTARWIAAKLGVRHFRNSDLGDVSTNLRFGTFYLKKVLDDLQGSPLLASAGYNAGPNRPRNWRATLEHPIEGAAFAEIIPFPETRDYVKKVMSNAAYYGALLTGKPQSLKQLLGSVAPESAEPSNLP